MLEETHKGLRHVLEQENIFELDELRFENELPCRRPSEREHQSGVVHWEEADDEHESQLGLQKAKENEGFSQEVGLGGSHVLLFQKEEFFWLFEKQVEQSNE